MTWTIIFDGWSAIARVLLVGVLGYVALVVLLRSSGKRTLSKMNAFDFVVTVALGSTLATILLSRDVSLATGVTALATLIGLQYVVAWLSVRSAFVRRITRSEPRLLVRNGQLLSDAMREERISRDEILSALRSQGLSRVEDVDALILETDGSFSAIQSSHPEDSGALQPVEGFEDGGKTGQHRP